MATRLVVPFIVSFLLWMFGKIRRIVCLFEWLMLCPNVAALPQTSHFIYRVLFDPKPVFSYNTDVIIPEMPAE